MNRGRKALFKNVTKDTWRRLRVFLRVWTQILGLFDLLKIALCELLGSRRELTLRPKALSKLFRIRALTTDTDVLRYVLHDQYHLPPSDYLMPPQCTILDLGSNIGLTLAHLKELYPTAEIFGYEMDKDNFELAKRNLENYEGVHIYNKAVWTDDSTIEYFRSSDPDSHSIHSRNREGLTKAVIESVSLKTILLENNLSKVDFLKMDIEGAERAIFESANLDWLSRVESINLEVHFSRAEREEMITKYIRLLEARGFRAWRDQRHQSSILAIRQKA